mgnify:CR=1 FL=1
MRKCLLFAAVRVTTAHACFATRRFVAHAQFLACVSLQLICRSIAQTERGMQRCAVLADLWARGFVVSSGVQFGGDFLVYKGKARCFCLIPAVSDFGF